MTVVVGTTLFAPDVDVMVEAGLSILRQEYRWYFTPSGGNERHVGNGRVFSPSSAGSCRYQVYALQSNGLEATAFSDPIPVIAADMISPKVSKVFVTAQDGGAIVDWSTDKDEGTFYWMIDKIASRKQEDVKSGIGALSNTREHTGFGTIRAKGAQATISATGLTNGETYYLHLLHEDTAGNLSDVFSSIVVPSIEVGTDVM